MNKPTILLTICMLLATVCHADSKLDAAYKVIESQTLGNANSTPAITWVNTLPTSTGLFLGRPQTLSFSSNSHMIMSIGGAPWTIKMYNEKHVLVVLVRADGTVKMQGDPNDAAHQFWKAIAMAAPICQEKK